MIGTPPVSVIVVNHMRRAELMLTLKALEYQRYRNFEVIVVSDMDAGEHPASPLAIRWVRYDKRNISAARNLGIKRSAGDLIAFIDDDAQPDFGWLEALVEPFENDAIGAAGGWVRGRNGVSFQWRTCFFEASGMDLGQEVSPGTRVFTPSPDRFVKTVGTNAMFRRAALEAVGGFDEAIRFYLDEADLNLRLSRAGWSTAIVSAAQVHHGFAAGPYRSHQRVPADLFEIGASQAYFAKRHWAGPSVAPAQRAEQDRRLDRLFTLGLLDGARWRWLMARYDAGRVEGGQRTPAIAGVSAPSERFSGTGRSSSELLVELSARLADRGAVASEASQRAMKGQRVRAFVEDIPFRALTVRFRPEGYFEHRFGIFGQVHRNQARPLLGFRARVDFERKRVAGRL